MIQKTIQKIKRRFFSKNNHTIVLNLIEELQAIRKKHETLVLFGSPTEGNWKGISIATKNLFPDNSIEIPQWYSNPVLSEKETLVLLNKIKELNFEKVIISGFANYFFDWIEIIHKEIPIDILYHFTLSEANNEDVRQSIEKLIDFGKQNKIKRFGFVKKGLNDVFKTLYNFDSYHQPLNTPTIPDKIEKIKLDKSKIHVGVFGADTFNKNLHNQVTHALMIENTVIHVLDKTIFLYLDKGERIIEHGKNLSREDFLSILGSMDLNLYMSYNESWGLLAYESEVLGITCLKPEHTDYFSIINAAIKNIKRT